MVKDSIHKLLLLVEDLGIIDLPVAIELVNERLRPACNTQRRSTTGLVDIWL